MKDNLVLSKMTAVAGIPTTIIQEHMHLALRPSWLYAEDPPLLIKNGALALGECPLSWLPSTEASPGGVARPPCDDCFSSWDRAERPGVLHPLRTSHATKKL